MEEKKVSSSNRNRSYTTIVGFLVKTISLLAMVGVLGWIFLMIWFTYKATLFGGYSAQNGINDIINYNLLVINHYKIKSFSDITSAIHSINEAISSILSVMLTILNNILVKFGYNPALSDKNTIQLITNIIFGTAEIAMTRLLIFFMSLPLLFSMLMLAVIDGLSQRDIRKFKGSRESTFFFHRVKPLTGRIFYILMLVFISLPIAVSNHYLMILISLLLSVMTMLTIKSYKKYL